MTIRYALVCITVFLSGCGSIFNPDPIGIGRDRDELKQSPCACNEVMQDYSGWVLPG
jgi:hypothetical protein